MMVALATLVFSVFVVSNVEACPLHMVSCAGKIQDNLRGNKEGEDRNPESDLNYIVREHLLMKREAHPLMNDVNHTTDDIDLQGWTESSFQNETMYLC